MVYKNYKLIPTPGAFAPKQFFLLGKRKTRKSNKSVGGPKITNKLIFDSTSFD
jgi:hypothetical protein